MCCIQWTAAGGMCGDSADATHSDGDGNKILVTQIINKSLPAPDDYPVRVFVNNNTSIKMK